MSIPTPTTRASRVTSMFDFTRGHGLEIGPLDAALVPREHADVSYADVFPRDQLVEHYGDQPLVRTEQIPEIDYPLWDGTRVRPLNEAAKDGAPFDWVYASHVIEHVPDLLGWLGQISELTTPDGALVLVIPDQRYTFDAHRPPTTVGQVVQANDSRDLTPSVRAVYDHCRSVISAAAPALWAGEVPGYEARIHDTGYLLEQVSRARTGEYIDCHVWLFTPQTFVEQVAELRELGLTDWSVEALQETPEDEIEFCVVLRKGSAGEATEFAAPQWVSAATSRAREVRRLEDVVQRQQAELTRQQEQLARQETRLGRQQAKLARKSAALRRVRRRAQRRQRQLRELRSSRRWRLASLLASPLDRGRPRR